VLTRKTEQSIPESEAVDALPPVDAAKALVLAQVAAAKSVLLCADVLAKAADTMAGALSGGGNIYYAAAGSSGLMAAADAMELKGTFGISPDRVRILMAGGVPTTADMAGDVEDAVDSLENDLAGIGPGDCLVTVAASGSTPFTVTAARIARRARATVIGIANVADAPLFEFSHHAIHLDTPPEMVSGSTRLGAGTAQKIALNTLSTLMGVKLGHVYKGMMVNVLADNAKLRARANAIVRKVAGVDEKAAAEALSQSGGDVKAACLLAKGAPGLGAAQAALEITEGRIGPAMTRLGLE
jgi:N-acetylmuramic acid 6-phosphate etherase